MSRIFSVTTGYVSFMADVVIKLFVLLLVIFLAYALAQVAVTPTIRYAPMAAESPVAQGQQAVAMASWFGQAGGPLPIQLLGVMSREQAQQGAALLSIGGAAPKAYRSGDWITPELKLIHVGERFIDIEQQGTVQTVQLPTTGSRVLENAIRPIKP